MENVINVVAAVIMDSDYRILCTQRGAEKRHSFKWEFPGGKVEPGETPEDALKRELMEELSIGSGINKKITEFRFSYDAYEMNLILFDASITKGEPILNVHNALKWTPLYELEKLEWLPADYPLIPKVIDYYDREMNGLDEDSE